MLVVQSKLMSVSYNATIIRRLEIICPTELRIDAISTTKAPPSPRAKTYNILYF